MTGKNLVTLGRPLGASLVFGGLLLAGLGAVAASWADLSAATEERDAKAELLTRGVAVGRRIAAARGAPTADPFVAADSATLAAAAVDTGLRSLATSAGLTLLSSRAEAKPDDVGGSPRGGEATVPGTRIQDQAVMEGTNEALQAALVALETGVPTMLVDDIAVEPSASDAGAGSVGSPMGATAAQAPRLHVSLTLSAYWRPGKTSPK